MVKQVVRNLKKIWESIMKELVTHITILLALFSQQFFLGYEL